MLFSVYHIFIKICIDRLCVIKSSRKIFLFVKSPVTLAVSWLKIESWSRFLPVMEATLASITFTTKNYFCLLLYVICVISVTTCINERNITETLDKNIYKQFRNETIITETAKKAWNDNSMLSLFFRLSFH